MGDTKEKLLAKPGLKAWGHRYDSPEKELILLAPGNIIGFDTSKPSEPGKFDVPIQVQYGGTVSEAVYVEVVPVQIANVMFEKDGDLFYAPWTIENTPITLNGFGIIATLNNDEQVELDAKDITEIEILEDYIVGEKYFKFKCRTGYGELVSPPLEYVEIPNAVTGLTLNTLPGQNTYWQYDEEEALDLEGLTFKVHYLDGQTEVIRYDDDFIKRILVYGFDTRLPGSKVLSFNVTKNETGNNAIFEDVFPVTVKRNSLIKLEITQLPEKRQFNEWDGELDQSISGCFPGLVVKGTYENGKVVENMTLTWSNFIVDRRPGKDRNVTVAVENQKVSFTIDIEPLKLEKIEMISPPEKTNYYTGEPLSVIGMALRYHYNSGQKYDIDGSTLSQYMDKFYGFNSSKPEMGQTVTFKEGDLSVSFKVNIQEYKLTGLRLERPPYRDWFYQYESPDFSGLKVTGIFPYGEEREDYQDLSLYEYYGFDSSKPVEDQEVTIKFGDQTVSFPVDILPIEEAAELQLWGLDYCKREYLLGESLNVDGLFASVSFIGQDYNSYTGKVETRMKGVTIYPTAEDITGFDSSQPANGQVLSFTFGGKTATYTVEILEPELVSLSVLPSRTTYYTGDVLNPGDITVFASYANGYVRTMPEGAYTISGFDSGRPVGEQTVTVSYKGKSDSFIIEILPLEVQSISVTSGITDYYIGEKLSLSALQINANYNNGTRKLIPASQVQISGFDSSREATGQEVTISYQGKQDVFVVNILSGTRPGTDPGSETERDDDQESGSGPDGGTVIPAPAPTHVPTPVPTPTPVPAENAYSAVEPRLDESTGKATVSLDADKLTDSFNRLNADEAGMKKLVIEIPAVEGANAYEVALPSEFLTEKGSENQLEIRTEIGTVTVPGNMLSNDPQAEGKTACVTIAHGDKSGLPGDVNVITRQEVFTLLYNVLKATGNLQGLYVQPGSKPGKTLSDFSDADGIASWAKEAMKLLVETGIIKGSGNLLMPKDTSNRAQMAQVLYNLLSR